MPINMVQIELDKIKTGESSTVNPLEYADFDKYVNDAIDGSMVLSDQEKVDVYLEAMGWYNTTFTEGATAYSDFLKTTTPWIQRQEFINNQETESAIQPKGGELATTTNNQLTENKKRAIINLAYAASGSSNYYNQLQPFLYSLDRYNSLRITDNLEFSGPMFITRPRLCLQTSNLRNHRVMSALDTSDPNSIAFMIRALLDTNLHKNNPVYSPPYTTSNLFDYRNPFLTPLCNAASSVSGLPDMLLETATTQGGFMAEAQQFVIGGDNLHRGIYDINITFKDVQYSPVSAILYYWLEYMRCVTRGYMLAYADDIDQQRLNYTVSIYLFNLDPSRKYITKWCKCTGCFPKSLPMGAMMSREYNGARIKASSELSIPFACNVVEYMDPSILMDFNQLVIRYCEDINISTTNKSMEPDAYGKATLTHIHKPMPDFPILNFSGLPYVTSDPYGMRLEWRMVNKNDVAPETANSKNTHQNQQLDFGVLELLEQNQVFSSNSKSIMEPINEYYYPGFTKYSKEFDYKNLADFIKKVIDVK